MSIVAWVSDGKGGSLVWARYKEGDRYGWPPGWWFADAIARGLVTAVTTKPGGTNIRGLTQDEYDLLIAEERARATLGEEP